MTKGLRPKESNMSAIEELEQWFAEEKAAGRIIDLKITINLNGKTTVEETARAILETVRGEQPTRDLDISNF